MKHHHALSALALLVLGSTSPAAFAQNAEAPAPRLPTELGIEAAQAAIGACKALDFTVSVAIVDARGTPRVLLSADGANERSSTSSIAKAKVAAAMEAPTGELAERAKSDPELAQKLAESGGGGNAGGVPIFSKGHSIGAIGVGGAHGGQYDEQCARTALGRIEGRY